MKSNGNMNIKAPVRRRWRFAKPQTPAWVDTLVAVSAAVAAHLLFFGVFSYETPENESRKTGSSLTLYNISGMPDDVKKEAVKWLSLHDPGLSVRGDSPIGFSAYLPENRERRIKVGEFRPKMDVPAVAELKYKPVKKHNVNKESLPVWIPDLRSAVNRVSAYDKSGRTLKINLAVPEDFQAGRNTFAVRGSGDFRRIEVLESLNAKQDMLAVRALQATDAGDGERITFVWMRGEK